MRGDWRHRSKQHANLLWDGVIIAATAWVAVAWLIWVAGQLLH